MSLIYLSNSNRWHECGFSWTEEPYGLCTTLNTLYTQCETSNNVTLSYSPRPHRLSLYDSELMVVSSFAATSSTYKYSVDHFNPTYRKLLRGSTYHENTNCYDLNTWGKTNQSISQLGERALLLKYHIKHFYIFNTRLLTIYIWIVIKILKRYICIVHWLVFVSIRLR